MTEEIASPSTKIDIQENQDIFNEIILEKSKAVVSKWLNKQQKIFSEMDNVSLQGERFELIVDARGYNPEDLKCLINSETVEIVAERTEMTSSGAPRNQTMTRSYKLHRNIKPEQAVCCLSQEGILIISVPWVD